MFNKIVAVSLITLSVSTYAEDTWFFSGNTLLETCEASQDLCSGYVLGVIDTEFLHNSKNSLLCLPKVNSKQLTDVVVKYLKSNPEYRHTIASSNVLSALVRAYPCTKKL